MQNKNTNNIFNIFVLVAALGYLVDIYDLILFGIVKNQSLIDIGIINKDALFYKGNFLISMQMAGMLIGGIIFGILGDKRGRLSTLFITIVVYSAANIANGFITNFTQYEYLRFIAGFGLSGELGVGITLVSEVMDKGKRGLGASLVAGIGVLGAIVAFFVSEWFNWRVAYWVGGGMGLLLLILRMMVYEPDMYKKTKIAWVVKGNFLTFFKDKNKMNRYLFSILLAIPTWYVISILAINAYTISKDALHINGLVKGSTSVMLLYLGAAAGSFLWGWLSRYWQSRRKALLAAILTMLILTICYYSLFNASNHLFYLVLFLLGFPMGGLWSIFMVLISEQFGTNLRATATTSAPNFVRGFTILITASVGFITPRYGLWMAGVITGALVFVISLISLYFVKETYGKELDFIENIP